MAASEHLNPQQFTWDDVKAQHPTYASYGFDHAVNELAHVPDGEMVTPHLPFTQEQVHPHDVRFQRYPASDPRVRAALEGYRSGAPVPPVLLVNRAGEHHTADGHHRLSAAEILDRPVPAVIGHSARADAYAGQVSLGYRRNRQPPG